ncbi:hydroxysteroid dehydrogenase-like protein 2 [Corvus moneduloides]|uniref:hydroxysteroid dehydrogenase-like protein 2 n=1 Tax=Corvus moneduloides TaxID=1196302 RepID=UPI001363E50C|nr:hydroxysteroid dehydrogenase-like protein 2 [Corvus moneduloides]
MTEEYVRSTQGVFQFELSGDGGGTWYIDLKTKGGSAGFGKPPVTADVVMSMSSADFVKMFTGEGQKPLSGDAGTGAQKSLCCFWLCDLGLEELSASCGSRERVGKNCLDFSALSCPVNRKSAKACPAFINQLLTF